MRQVVMLTWALLVSATHMPSFVGAGVAMAQEHREASKRAREARSAWAEGIMDTGGGELQVCPLLVDQVIGEPRYADGLQPLGSKRARTGGSTDGNDAAPMDTESVSPAADADALRTVLDLEPESRPVDVCKIGERGGGKLTFEGCKIGERGGGKLTCGGRRPGASPGGLNVF